MTRLHKLRIPSVLKWVFLDFTGTNPRSSKTTLWTTGYHSVQSLRFYGRKRADSSENGSNFLASQQEAQAALLDYLHSTSSLQFLDAEYISRNSPHFLEKLIRKSKNVTEIGRSVAQILRYNPINEFEPFFESMGLKPFEYRSLLPRNLIFLNDDAMLLENYHVLCNYGIARKHIGMIYKEATEVFKYDYGVLQSKLQTLEEMGLNQSTLVKLVSSSPNLLTGDKTREFHKVLGKFKSIGIENDWVEGHLLEGITYNCFHMLELLCLLSNMGCSEEQLGKLIHQQPELLFEASGHATFSLIGFLLKFGSTKNEICSMLLQFPQGQVRNFVCKLRQCYHFLIEIEMEVQDIGRIVRSHSILLGSCSLKKLNSLLANLNTGKKRIRDIVKENPQVLKDWVLGSRVKPLPKLEDEIQSQMMKTKFLLDLGFVENSNEMKRALKVFRGKGGELQERFDCFIKAGLNRKDVLEMIKIAPQVLNQSKDLIEMKIDFLVSDLGYPPSCLVSFPSYVSFTIKRVKLRFLMYDWLKGQGSLESELALGTVVASSDRVFVSQYVNQHPRGPEVWLRLKKQIYPN